MICLYFRKLSFNSGWYVPVGGHATSHRRGDQDQVFVQFKRQLFHIRQLPQENHESTSLLTAVQMPGGLCWRNQMSTFLLFCQGPVWLLPKWDEIGVSDNDEECVRGRQDDSREAENNLNPKVISGCSESSSFRECTNLNLKQPRHSL